jgi:hypothetical protein
MEAWTLLWKILFIGSLILFTGMAVWVTIGGYQDIKILLKRLQAQADEREANHKKED